MNRNLYWWTGYTIYTLKFSSSPLLDKYFALSSRNWLLLQQYLLLHPSRQHGERRNTYISRYTKNVGMKRVSEDVTGTNIYIVRSSKYKVSFIESNIIGKSNDEEMVAKARPFATISVTPHRCTLPAIKRGVDNGSSWNILCLAFPLFKFSLTFPQYYSVIYHA